jgi:hypothetical protein
MATRNNKAASKTPTLTIENNDEVSRLAHLAAARQHLKAAEEPSEAPVEDEDDEEAPEAPVKASKAPEAPKDAKKQYHLTVDLGTKEFFDTLAKTYTGRGATVDAKSASIRELMQGIKGMLEDAIVDDEDPLAPYMSTVLDLRPHPLIKQSRKIPLTAEDIQREMDRLKQLLESVK